MEQYNSKEVGQKLAESLLKVIDPAQASLPVEDKPKTIPPLGVLPRAFEGVLPGGLTYVHAVKPELKPMLRPKVLKTSTVEGFTQMTFDDYDILRSISFVGSRPVQSQNILSLLGAILVRAYEFLLLEQSHLHSTTAIVS